MLLRPLSSKLLTFAKHLPCKVQLLTSHSSGTPVFKKIMAEMSPPGKPLQEILQTLENFASLSLAESWDNVGLLVDPMENDPVKVILLTNDLTENVLEEAIQLKTGLIISYHPNIFQGLKSVSARTWKERIVVNCIRNKIAVFSPHTTWDAVQGGVNDWLCGFVILNQSCPIIPNVENPQRGAGRLCHVSQPINLKTIIELLKTHIGISHLRVALAKDKDESDTISTFAVCAGSGASVLNGVESDLYITGEMLHHDVLDATQKGIHVILCNHSDSERGFLKGFQSMLQNQLLKDEVKVVVSQVDCDPLKTI